MSNILFELTINNDKRVIPEIARFISDSAVKLGLSDKKAGFLCFTLETILESRTDAISEQNPTVTVRAEDDGSKFKVSITDFGSPYILSKNQQAILKRKLVDKYSFEQKGRKGQSLSFYYKHDAVKPALPEKKEEESLLDTNFSFRRLKHTDSDILEAVKCLYDTYGYGYYHQNLYSVEAFKKYMSNGRYVPIVAANEHGQVMGYCALDENEWFAGVPEFSNLVTKPVARGLGLATSIFRESEKIAKKLNYEGIHVSAVAYHPYTQKMCNKLGYTPSAVEYSINPAGTGGYGDGDRRLDCVIGVKIFNKEKLHTLYLDPSCNKMFSGIYSAEELKYEIKNDYCDPSEKESLLSYVVDTDTGNCFVKIDECGENFEKDIKDLLDKEEVKETDVVTVNLNMNDCCSATGFKVLRSLGFICVGCIPGCLTGDYIILQAFKVKPVFEKTVLEEGYKALAQEVYELNNISV